MSFIAKNPLMAASVNDTPSAPVAGTRGLFAKGDGWYDIDSAGVAKKILNEDDAEIADGSVTSNKIADGSVTTEKLSDTSVTYTKLDDAVQFQLTNSAQLDDYKKIKEENMPSISPNKSYVSGFADDALSNLNLEGVYTVRQYALDEMDNQKGFAYGIAPLDKNGKVPQINIPDLKNIKVVEDEDDVESYIDYPLVLNYAGVPIITRPLVDGGYAQYKFDVSVNYKGADCATLLYRYTNNMAYTPTWEDMTSGVSTEQIYDGAVTTQKIADGAVTGDKIADGAIEYSKLGVDVTDKVNELKSDLNEITIDGKNLFDSSKITEGYFVNQNTGMLTANVSFKSSDYISIIPSTSYTISVKSLSVGTTAQIRYFQYDENKNPIASSGGINASGKEITFVSDVSAKYVRFSYVVYSSEVMLEKGESATEYEEYRGKYINPEKIDSYTKEQSDMRYCAVPEIFKINLPDKIYATVGIELNIYFDNIVDTHDTDYSFDVTCDKGMHLQRCYRYTPNSEDVGSYPITLSVTNNHGQTVEKTSTIIVTAETISPEKTVKILILGDSTTAGGTTVEKIHKNFENTGVTIQTLGTRGNSPYNHEGRSGWSAGTYVGYANVGSVTNAFYNNGFDASYYFSQNNIPFPDWFIINLGINDLFAYTKDAQMNAGIRNFVNNINTMITSIKAASSSIKIGLALTIPPNYSQDAFGKAYKCGQTRMRYKRNNFYLVNKLIETYSGKENTENIYLIPIFTNLDTVNNMGFEEIKVNARNTTTYKSPIGNGGVHPVESGYWQTADVYTSFIKANS